MSKPGVYFVTMQQLLEWMVNPIPIDKMDEWLAKRCGQLEGRKKGMHIKDPVVPNLVQNGGISSGSMSLVGGSVVLVLAVLGRRRKLRRGARPPR